MSTAIVTRSSVKWVMALATLALAGAALWWLKGLLEAQSSPTRSQAPESRARIRVLPDLFAAGVAYPPQATALLVFTDRGAAELVAQSGDGFWHPVRRYTFTERRSLDLGVRHLDVVSDKSLRDQVALPWAAIEEVVMLATSAREPGLALVVAPTDLRVGMEAFVPDEPIAQALSRFGVAVPPTAIATHDGFVF